MIDGECQTFVSDCHVRAATELIRHTWDPVILAALRAGPIRRNELLRRIAGVSDKVLTQALQRLQSRQLVVPCGGGGSEARHRGAVYELSPLGRSFAEGPLAHMAQWAAQNQIDLIEPSQREVRRFSHSSAKTDHTSAST
jgi:DNA-binding HxlR family transcriptional regulator